MNLAFEPKEECGISLVGIPKNVETRDLLEAAKLSGSPRILSQEDAAAFVTNALIRNNPSSIGEHWIVSVIERRAVQFLADAKAAIERLK